LADRALRHDKIAVVGQTADLAEACRLIEEAAPHVALIDPVRSDGRGEEFVRAIAETSMAMRPVVVVHLSYFEAGLWATVRAAGASDLILKQADLDVLSTRLLGCVSKYLPRERWPSILTA
jgi:DNA-binding NarL/FixJ family response regulator